LHPVIAFIPRRAGYTLVELVVVVLILGILAAIAAPRLLGVSKQAEAAGIVSTVNTIFTAVELYAAENGKLPDDTPYGDTPVELEPYMRTGVFGEITALGGYYDWNGVTTGAPVVGVSIRVSDWSDPAVQTLYDAIEECADDGGENTGWITRNALAVHFELDDK